MLLVFSIFLAGCGSNNGASNSSPSPSQNSEGTSNEATTGEKKVFKIAHIAPEHHIWTPSMEKFKEELERLSDGRLSLDIFTGGVLGTDADMMNQLEAGTLEMAWVNATELSNYSDSFNAWVLPFTIADSEVAFKLGESEEGVNILKTLDNHGVHGLGYVFIENRGLIMKDSLIRDINDIKGKKIRVTPSPITIDWWETLGALPTPIDLGELFSAFQTGVVDGIDQGAVTLVGGKYYEISKYFTLTNHTIFNGAAMVSQKVWDQLSDEDKLLIEEAFEVAKQYNLELSMNFEEESLEEFKQHGGIVAEIEDKTEILELADEFQKKYANQDPLIKAFIEKAREFNPN